MAPEVLKGEYNEKCDIWSLGIILNTMLSGKHPSIDQNDEQNKEYNDEQNFSNISAGNSVSPDAKDLL